jgi:hypothetical protein
MGAAKDDRQPTRMLIIVTQHSATQRVQDVLDAAFEGGLVESNVSKIAMDADQMRPQPDPPRNIEALGTEKVNGSKAYLWSGW